jgi:hypothetical protein
MKKAELIKKYNEGDRYPTVSSVVEAGFIEALGTVLAKLPKDSFALAGGLAVLHWSDFRTTHDVDLAVTGMDFKKLEELFPGGESKPLIYTVKIEGQRVEFLQPKYFKWTDEAVKSAPMTDYLGQQIKIILPEYLILYKLAAGRDKDQEDLEALLRVPGVSEKALKLCARYLPEELDDLKQMALTAEYM